MNPSDKNDPTLSAHVACVVATSWPDFAREHPALARVIDETILCDHVTRSLADDAAFHDAYHAAVEAHVGAAAMAHLVERFVVPVLRRLL